MLSASAESAVRVILQRPTPFLYTQLTGGRHAYTMIQA